MAFVIALLTILLIYMSYRHNKLEARVSYLEHKLYCMEVKKEASK